MTRLDLPVPQPLPPMEALTTDEIPEGDEWIYEPKWDGFRCVAFRSGSRVELQSKSRKSLTRYFPEVVAALAALRPRNFVLDGELAVPGTGPSGEARLDFDALLQRIHPAESRVRKLATETPATFLVFDLLATGARTSLLDRPLEDRRPKLEGWAASYLDDAPDIHLSPATTDRVVAQRWMDDLKGVDGVMAKILDSPYRAGERDGAVKVKRYRSADCVVGGFRRSSSGTGLGSLLLGLYDDDGRLHHVGYTSAFTAEEGDALLGFLEDRVEPPGFTGNAPGGPSRWSSGRSSEWEPVRPELVVEVRYDHVSNNRFRHGTNLLRPRPDKAPEQCTFDQIAPAGEDALTLLDRPRR